MSRFNDLSAGLERALDRIESDVRSGLLNVDLQLTDALKAIGDKDPLVKHHLQRAKQEIEDLRNTLGS